MTDSDNRTTVLFVTGMSGAGRTSVANVLEDDGWYVSDNVPMSLIAALVEMVRSSEVGAQRIAMVVRGGDPSFDAEMKKLRSDLEEGGADTSMIFVDASDDVLVRRFEQVRRRHPMQGNGTLSEGIAAERAIMDPVATVADKVIDTSNLSSTRLRSIVENVFPTVAGRRLSIAVQSFGFKYGLPIDCDLVADVRFLPNPYWIPELREHNGREPQVRDYVLGQEDAAEFLERYVDIVGIVGRGYLREGKGYMTLGVGCTGGKHRSVAMSQDLARRLSEAVDGDGNLLYDVEVTHRDLGRE
ncbi:RNase adapter RapZ [Gordonia sp. (in: high G+C Gram-positive bacteria)]|uniref:RNase adapter RapZ n=1 Tax=Gordonia sp. (in: high G+C Gram-positive bacteria) TaxID=84139 RepID=UPI0016AB88BF|nr:RNase adapter RapZ [Gordonia sp. (in: high G+C Gram-positive bacteria)]NLG46175.1 RNase adapter RapZ [Gordonia sp. (in: high G+C Gram-positive bacteria)]